MAAVTPGDLTIDPAMLRPGAAAPDLPLAFVLLDDRADPALIGALPPYPVIGIGLRDHPAAGLLDTIVEPPVSIAALIRQIVAMPLAAAALVQALRVTEPLAPDAALTVESMAYAMLQAGGEHAAWTAARPVPTVAPPGRLRIVRDDACLRLTIERPAARNAIDRALRDDLRAAFEMVALDPDIAVVELRAAGAMFSTGGDLAEFGTTRDPAVAHAIRSVTLPAHAIMRVADRFVAHVQGGCVGAGVEMAAFAARLTANSRAWFQLPEIAMGLIPGAGGCVSLPRRIGRQRAALMILSGRRIDARTALRWGLVDALVDDASRDDGGADVAGRQIAADRGPRRVQQA